MLKLSPLATTFTCGLFAVGLLAGCTTTSTSTPSPSVSVSREAVWGLDSTNLQLVNNSGKTITVVSKRSDSSRGLGPIRDGGTASAEGSTTSEYDVAVNVNFIGGDSFTLSATNRPFKPPVVHGGDGCGDISLNVGDENNYFFQKDKNSTQHGFTIKRLPDDDWKQFQVTFIFAQSADSSNVCTPGGGQAG